MFEDSVILNVVLAPLGAFLDPGDRLSLVYQCSALLVAIGVYVTTRASDGNLRISGLIRWLVPMEILRHPSAQADFAFFIVNRMLRATTYGAIAVLSPIAAAAATAALVWAFGPPGSGVESSLWLSLLLTLLALIVLDGVLWAAHYVFHVVPALWDYHKVHHSAEVMTPITAARMHPVEEMTDSAVATMVIGGVYGGFEYAFGPGAMVLTIFDVNILLCVFFLAAFNLRHSHVWVRYPVWVQHIFVCPAQHHIHHSTARHHWDKNMGFVFAFWDWAAGTLYAPKEKEDITYGLGTEEDGGAWHSLGALYFLPFRQSWQRIRALRGRHAQGQAPTEPAE